MQSLLLGETWRGEEGSGKVWTISSFIQLIEVPLVPDCSAKQLANSELGRNTTAIIPALISFPFLSTQAVT